MLTELTKFAVPDIDVNVIWPLLLVLLTGLVVMVADLVIGRRKETPLANLPAALGVAGLAFVLIFELFWFNKLGLATGYITTLSGMVLLDNYALFFNTIFLAAGIVSILIAWNYLHVEDIHTGEYYMLLIFAVFGMMIMASTTSLLMIFIGLEIMSIAVYVLAGMIRRQKKSTESALKYFLLGAFSTGFLLYGITGLYIATGSLDLRGIAAAGITGNFYAYLGLGFLIVGFGFKIAAVPFHMWTPDVYEGAPTSVTAFMAVAVKAAAFAAFLRVMLICFESLTGEWYYILYVLAILTMTYGNVVALAQKNIKRMLAYSSIAHAGYLLTAMVAATNPSARDMAVESVLYYLLVYTFMNLGAFGVVAYLSKKDEQDHSIDDYAGMAYRHPLASLAMAMFLFSLAGIPPLAGFMGKFYIFASVMKAELYFLAIIGVLNSAISVYYYIRVVYLMYAKDPVVETPAVSYSAIAGTAIAINAVAVLVLGILPGHYLEMATQAVATMLP